MLRYKTNLKTCYCMLLVFKFFVILHVLAVKLLKKTGYYHISVLENNDLKLQKQI